MSNRRVTPAGLISVGAERIFLSNSTASALNSTIRASATVVDISVETNDARYRADGTDPTLTTGVLMQSDTLYTFYGYNGSANWKFQRSTGNAVLNVHGWRHPGDQR